MECGRRAYRRTDAAAFPDPVAVPLAMVITVVLIAEIVHVPV